MASHFICQWHAVCNLLLSNVGLSKHNRLIVKLPNLNFHSLDEAVSRHHGYRDHQIEIIKN